MDTSYNYKNLETFSTAISIFNDDIEHPLKQSRNFVSNNISKSENINYSPNTYSKY
jgi:hypothetical protein